MRRFFVFSFASAALLMMSAHAQTKDDCMNHNMSYSQPELVYHTAAPGFSAMPRSDLSLMVMAYDITLYPREDKVFVRWRHLNEEGEGEGFWTRWRDYDNTLTFSKPGIYVLEAYAEAIGKDKSPTLNVTFKVDYMGMTMAPSITLKPYGLRGYNVFLSSPYDADIYYRWRHYDSDTWLQWTRYTTFLPFTEVGKYVLEARCEDDPLGAYIEVPGIDDWLTGDVNYNGTVDIDDVTALINMLLNPEILIGTGDVDNDGNVNINDVTTLINMLLNQ